MPRILVIHYEPAEAPALAERIRREGFEAEVAHRGMAGFRAIRASPPAAIVIDLSRMPSYGRIMGVMLRDQKATRMIPLVFVEGDPAKTPMVRAALPDAPVVSLLRIGPTLRKAISRPPTEPAPANHLGLPLLDKLHIKEDSSVALLHAPESFRDKLGRTPKRASAADADVVILFVKSSAVLGRELAVLSRHMRRGRALWVVWPKKASGVPSDLTSPRIVEMCRAVGLSGYKTFAVDETWSAMAVALPGKKRSA